MKESCELSFSVRSTGHQFGYATIAVPASYVDRLYTQASKEQQCEAHTHGFEKGGTPIEYIKQSFQPHLLEHIKEFFFKYFVIHWLYKKLFEEKILLAGEPRLIDIMIKPQEKALFNFSINLIQQIHLQGWKRFPFKTPKRKNYKDLDRQVENFLKEEAEKQKKSTLDTVTAGDWVNFDVCLLSSENEKPLLDTKGENLWLRVGETESDQQFRSMFFNKKIGDIFLTHDDCLQSYFSTHFETHYLFRIKITDIIPHLFFCLDLFKKHFKIKTQKELHQKLIEVFSYRNDMSQRRMMAEEALKLLLSKFQIEPPKHLVLRQQKVILDIIRDNPDYQVYKMQPEFKHTIEALAQKQVKEAILMHQLAFHENLMTTHEDVKGYLNLTKRSRTKEFIYFEPPPTKHQGQETPVSASMLSQCCLREKTLNHIIYHLTRNR